MTPSMDMAVEARVPCPLCGGLIHPVAGRCKHCKQDLVALRASRLPAVGFRLPAIGAQSAESRSQTPAAPPQPILPPRPTEIAVDSVPPVPSAWRSWPVIVMGISVLAILGALFVLFVLPESEPAHAGKLPPATQPMPERMPTDPLPQADPWGGAQPSPPHAQAVPTPDDTDQLDQLGQLALPAPDTFQELAFSHFCRVATKCGLSNGFLDSVCMALSVRTLAVQPKCDEGKRCLDAIDRLQCTMQVDDAGALLMLMNHMQDCAQALQHC